MSRRDTIIVAVLVNAGLLIVLFASAIKSNTKEELAVAAPPAVQQSIETPFAKELTPVVGDEVDQALNQFRQTPLAAAQPEPVPQSVQPVIPQPQTPIEAHSSSFANDLNAISVPETPSSPALQTLTAPLPSPEKPMPEYFEIKVKKGDVLEKLARHHHTTVAEIMKANKLSSTNLRIGQVLKIPNKSIRKADVSTISSAKSDAAPSYYVVKKGDNPWTIAMKNHVKVEDLLKLNNMSEDQARPLRPGDKIRIR